MNILESTNNIYEKERLKIALSKLNIDVNNLPDFILKSNQFSIEENPIELQKKVKRFDNEIIDLKDSDLYKHIPIDKIDIVMQKQMNKESIEIDESRTLADVFVDVDKYNGIEKDCFVNSLERITSYDDIEFIQKVQSRYSDMKSFDGVFEKEEVNWNIYYSKQTDRYILPYSVFNIGLQMPRSKALIYLLNEKSKFEQERKLNPNAQASTIFAAVNAMTFTGKLLDSKEVEELQQYMTNLTKSYPTCKEIMDRGNNSMLFMSGEMKIYDELKSSYKADFSTRGQALQFLGNLKIMNHLSENYNFESSIDDNNQLIFSCDGKQVSQEMLNNLVRKEYEILEAQRQNVYQDIQVATVELNNSNIEKSKNEAELQKREYAIQEYQESQKNVFKKIKYFFSRKQIGQDFNEAQDKENIETNYNYENRDVGQISIDTIIDLRMQLKELNEKLNNAKSENELNNEDIQYMKDKITAYDDFISKIKDSKNMFDFLNFSKDNEFKLPPLNKSENFTRKLQQSISDNNIEKREPQRDIDKIEIDRVAEEMETKQRNNLLKEETDALHIYKSCAYTTMNAIKKDLAEKGEISEDTRHILEQEYNDLRERLDHPEKYLSRLEQMRSGTRDPNFKDATTMLSQASGSLEEYIDKMQLWCSQAESAFKKVTTDGDIFVYRGAMPEELGNNTNKGTNVSQNRFISTTTDLRIAQQFWNYRDNESQEVVLYKIKIPRGTPAIFYTSSLFEEEQIHKGFPDEQREVLLDGSLIDMDIEAMKKMKITNYSKQEKSHINGENTPSRQITIVECTARTKERTIDKANNIEDVELNLNNK